MVSPSRRVNLTNRYLQHIRLTNFDQPDLEFISSGIEHDIAETRVGGKSSLACYPSLLETLPQRTLIKGQEALVIVLGGTKIRGAIAVAGDNNSIRLQGYEEVTYSKRTFNNPEEFFEEGARVLTTALGEVEPKRRPLGLTWAYPGPAEVTPTRIDIRSDPLTKGLVVKGIEGQSVGDGILRAIGKVFPEQGITQEEYLIAGNDTTQTSFATAAKIGLIAGTGYNLAVVTGGKLLSLEAGNYNGVPVQELARRAANRVDESGRQRAEFQVTFLGEQLGEAITELAGAGALDLSLRKPMGTEAVSAVLKRDWSSMQREWVEGELDGKSQEILLMVASVLRNRSADIIAATLAAGIKTSPQDYPEERIRVSADGSVVAFMPGHRSRIVRTAQMLVPEKKFTIDVNENAEMIGSGRAALLKASQAA